MNSADREITDAKLKAWASKFMRDNNLHIGYPSIQPFIRPVTKSSGNFELDDVEFDSINEAIECLDLEHKLIIKVNYCHELHIEKDLTFKCRKADTKSKWEALDISKSQFYKRLNRALTAFSQCGV